MRRLWPTALLGAILVAGCGGEPSNLPAPGSERYQDLVQSFYTGVAALEVGQDVRAREELTRASELAPGEPAVWANLGLLDLVQGSMDQARAHLVTARDLDPGNSRIEFLLGDLEARQGRLAQAMDHLMRAVELDGGNPRALYAIAVQTERRSDETSDLEAQQTLGRLLALRPENLEVLLQATRLAAKRGDGEMLQGLVERLAGLSSGWPEPALEQLADLERVSREGEVGDAAVQALFLRNLLQPVPAYRRDADAVSTPVLPAPFARFLRLPSPDAEPSQADLTTAFVTEALAGAPAGGVAWIRPIYLDDTGRVSLVWADGSGIHVAGGSSLDLPEAAASGPRSLAAADLTYDFRTDFVVATSSGIRIYRQEDGGEFADVTGDAGLDRSVSGGRYSAAWPFDVDLDGDLDVVVSPEAEAPFVVRNNGDGTFAVVRPFPDGFEAAGFVSADVDGDGDPDPAFLGADGSLRVFANERLGAYRERGVPAVWEGAVLAVAAGDLGGDGVLDLVLLTSEGSIHALTDLGDGENWTVSEVASDIPLSASPDAGARAPALALADFDNNGAIDILAGAGQVLLATSDGWARVEARAAGASIADLDADGLLDVIGLAPGPVALLNQASGGYRWQTLRTRAAEVFGDQRINPFGIGGEIEVRAGLLTQKQIIAEPSLHFGLGDRPRTDIARIIWPNGLVQVEFDLEADQSLLTEQRIKGSCPSLFAWNGREFAFVKDAAPWSPALGLHINAQEVAGIYQTEEWFRIPGSQLVARDGFYDLRITAELWETYYIDHYSLMVVDHPAGEQVYADERFAVPPPPLRVYATSDPRPFLYARDSGGQDVTRIVGALDEQYLDTFELGQYQGAARDHWVELELPPEAPASGPLYLIGDGWLHPTDATVNIALSQGADPAPEGLRIEVQDSAGNWHVAREGLGFPAGKLKTVVLELEGLFLPDAPRRLRLGASMEIYWDRLSWAVGTDETGMRTERIPAAVAELAHRGFSVMRSAGPSSPEIPDYHEIAGTTQKWRDLEGYYTRYGDIGELLGEVDDRIVIVNAGDEIRLRFAAPPPPPEGWTRDFILIGDGWIKDGDYNSLYSRTVLPLPYHAMEDYLTPPGALEDDPAYRLNPEDWQRFHTRYVTPDAFRRALVE